MFCFYVKKIFQKHFLTTRLVAESNTGLGTGVYLQVLTWSWAYCGITVVAAVCSIVRGKVELEASCTNTDLEGPGPQCSQAALWLADLESSDKD